MNMLLSFLIQSGAEGVTPWFDPQSFGTYFGAIGGATVGCLGGLFGGVGSWAAQRNKWRGLMLGGMALSGGLCALALIAGLFAVVSGQPYGIWYPLTLVGLIGAGCFLGLLPVMRKRYDQADARRLEAQALRRS